MQSHELRSILRNAFRWSYRFQRVIGDTYASCAMRKRFRMLCSAARLKSPNKVDITLSELLEITSLFKRSLRGKHKAFDTLLESAYGIRGPLRFPILRPYLKELEESFKAVKAIHPLLKSPISHDLHQKLQREPMWPVRDKVLQGPLNPKRRKNIVNRWWNNRVMNKLRPPIPSQALASLEGLSRGDFAIESYRQHPVLSKRFIRRRAALLLDKVPIYEAASGVIRRSPYAAIFSPNSTRAELRRRKKGFSGKTGVGITVQSIK